MTMRTFSYLALGDSYTIGESADAAERYPVQASRLWQGGGEQLLSLPEIIATTGWTTGDLLSGMAGINSPRRKSYDLVTLLIGVNNQYQGRDQEEYRVQFTTLLQQAIGFAGGRPSRMIVLSIPDYSATPFAQSLDRPRIAQAIDLFNQINREISTSLGSHYLDITGESRKAADDLSLVANDGLHYSGKEYLVWATMMQPLMREILG
jgi:lysophospholipase L1-like esterase